MESRLEVLRPECLEQARKWLHICNEDLGLSVRALETLRTRERQASLVTEGKSQIKLGWHNVGLALDFGVFVESEYQRDDSAGLYTKAGLVAEALGFTWGGRWTHLRDYGHIEYHPGFTFQQFLHAQKEGVVA